MRDESGKVMGATCLLIEGKYKVDVAEVVAARHALLIALESEIHRVVLESDCSNLIHHLKKKIKEMTSFGFIVLDILMLASNCFFIAFNHVCRFGNKVAHKLAHLSRNFSEMRVWL